MLRVAEQAFRTDTGRQRTANEDSLYARAPLFAVADGMGGAQAGEVASRIAAEAFEPAERGSESPETYLRSIAETANRRIHSLAQEDESHSGMGTTLTAALVEGDEVSFAHVGDSRAYLFRDGQLRLLTSDHSLVEELRRQGRLTEEQAEDHPQRSIITRALGPEDEVEVDTLTLSARPGDVFLICSDGLTTMVKDDRIAEILAASPTLDDAASRLVREANEAGGRDNITVVAFRLEDPQAPGTGEQATLVGPSAAGAGLDSERIRTEAARSQAASRREREPARAEKPRRGRTIAKALAGLLIAALVVGGAVIGIRQVHFLGTDEGGRLAVYRGLPYDLAFGIELYSEVEASPVQVASLPEDRRDEATDHTLRSESDARDLLENLEAAALTSTSEPPPAGDRGKGESQAGGGSGAEGSGPGDGDGPSGDGGQEGEPRRDRR